ncbi:pentraxin-4 [Colossoma macropomum]|uniref:pentraxin-4 n=1 Tax=Colossoma macropomum TaxID=42526 RepID=UPI001863BD46|nr:pentraxin-4 [Colossoma macropomum]
MGCSRAAVGVLLILVLLQVQLNQGQRSRLASAETRKRLYQRLRRLDEQFRRFQEMTLTHLQSIAESYNISYSMDSRFLMLTQHFEGISKEISSFRAATEQDLNSLKSWSRKLQRKTRRLELRLVSAERAVKENARLAHRQLQEHRTAMANLTQELGAQQGRIRAVEAQQGEIHHLQDALREQMSKLEDQMRSVQHTSGNALSRKEKNQVFSHRAGQPKVSKDTRMKSWLPPPAVRATSAPDPYSVETPSQTVAPPTSPPLRHKIPQHYTPKKATTICNVHSMLLFPSASTKNYVTFHTPFLTGVHELSVCTWLRVDAGYVGTLLSYATEDNDNTLVLYGRRSSVLGNMDFVIGDPAYRELTTDNMLDGQWHHMCVVWSSIEGRFWHYVDRRLISTGSKFQKDYEIPPRGSMILGQEQDTVGGGFDQAEAFVGRLAGFALWTRALSPGEVSGLATGKGLPRGAALTLDDVEALHGSVQQVTCQCLEHCT